MTRSLRFLKALLLFLPNRAASLIGNVVTALRPDLGQQDPLCSSPSLHHHRRHSIHRRLDGRGLRQLRHQLPPLGLGNQHDGGIPRVDPQPRAAI
jgi:hypothetical protein